MRLVRPKLVFLAGALILLFFLAPVRAEETTSAPPSESPPAASPSEVTGVSKDELKSLLESLENEEKRKELIQRLKVLVELQEAGTKEKGTDQAAPTPAQDAAQAIQHISDRLDEVSSGVVDVAKLPSLWLNQVSSFVTDGVRFFQDSRHRLDFMWFLFFLVAGWIGGWICGLVLRRVKTLPDVSVRPGGGRRLAQALVHTLIQGLPYLVIYGVAAVLFHFFPTLPVLESVTAALLRLWAIYRFAFHLIWFFCAPEAGSWRVLEVDEELADHLWTWSRRLLRYTAFYFLVDEALLRFIWDGTTFFLLRNLLLFGFPLLITLFLSRLSPMILERSRDRLDRMKEKPSLAHRLLILEFKYWHWILIIHAWALYVYNLLTLEAEHGNILLVIIGSMAAFSGTFVAAVELDNRLTRFFRKKKWHASPFFQISRVIGIGAVLVLGVAILAEVWSLPLISLARSWLGPWIATRLVPSMLALAITMVLVKVTKHFSLYMLEEKNGREISPETKTLIPILATAVKIVIFFVGGVVFLHEIGVNIQPILAGAGIIGVAIGLGAQNLIKDVINGAFILLQNIISVGDWVIVGNKSGLVESVGLRSVRLRDLEYNVHLVPNSSIDILTNLTKDYSGYVFDVGVAYRENVDEVIEVISGLGQEMREDPNFGPNILRPFEILGLDRFDDSAVVIRARVTTKPMTQWAVGREFNRRLKRRFDELGIEIPFPHRTVFMGEPKTPPPSPPDPVKKPVVD